MAPEGLRQDAVCCASCTSDFRRPGLQSPMHAGASEQAGDLIPQQALWLEAAFIKILQILKGKSGTIAPPPGGAGSVLEGVGGDLTEGPVGRQEEREGGSGRLEERQKQEACCWSRESSSTAQGQRLQTEPRLITEIPN